MVIKVHNPTKLPVIDYREVKEFQGNLKDLSEKNYAKLLKSFNEHGFFVPMFLWKKKKEFFAIDTHQRLRVLKKENVTPYELPYVLIDAENEQDAKKKLLVITSQYGRITQDGLDEFAFDIPDEWKAESIHFDAIPDWGEPKGTEESNVELISEFAVEVKCVSEREQEKLFNELKSKGYECRVLSL